MNGADHDALRADLGPYVLGALPPDERARLEAHLEGCPACRVELAELAPLPGLLTRLGDAADELESAPSGAAPPLADVVGRLGERRRARRRRRWAGLAAAAAALALVVAVGTAALLRDDSLDDAVRFASADGAAVALVDARGWGMAVEFRATALPVREGYALLAVATDGHRAPVATWTRAGEAVRLDGSCYLTPGDVERLEVVGSDEADVVEVLAASGDRA